MAAPPVMSELETWWERNAPRWASDATDYIGSIWNEGAYGLTFGQIIMVVLIMGVAILIRGLFARTLVVWVTRWAAGSTTQIDDALVKAIATPLKIIPVVAGIYASIQVLDVDPAVELYASRIIQSVVTLTIFWSLSRATRMLEYVMSDVKRSLSGPAVDWMIKALQFILVALGLGAVAQQWGIAVAPLLAGLGVFGIAVGLGAQDLFRNLISGLLIIGEKRFVPGEWILVDDVVEGTVVRINFRSTLVRRFDQSPVYVPNSKLADAAVTNFTRMTHRRIKWAVGVEYSTTVEQLKAIRQEIEDWLMQDDRIAKPPEVALFVRVDAFNASSIDLLIYTFTKTTNWGEWLKIKEEFAYIVMDIIERNGAAFAFPSQTIYMDQSDPPEIMAPPDDKAPVKRVPGPDNRKVGAQGSTSDEASSDSERGEGEE
ncbi:transporter, small conductance mechanosensitive ion channel (MscS) family [Hyphomonas neptunium ATCC 15444]|uniref:Transporter, small conductance mechanosensitive ion channel (MscS) family n=2 Tax=Hyphomonas TaxID=85 RepID=Q0C2E9_HYPNA|nr:MULTISPECIES: mechanosensitive ion channel family protein [Hyphomonas]ABI75775.1 transporter, small conductance mechanosensitive ion channel (MscS) family [Hyphomonas neptunium ATCC 15444]